MSFNRIIIAVIFIQIVGGISAQVLINTSFEGSDNYVLGSLNAKNKWTVTAGTAEIVSSADYIKEGTQAVKIASTSTAIQVDQISFPTNALALSGDVYVDFWIKLISYPSVNFGISGYDLGTYTNRSFMLEFQPTGKIKLYDGSSGWTTQPTYSLNSWKRISIKIDNTGTKCQYAIDGVVINKLFSFREIKTGATSFDFHSLRFIMDAGAANVAIDNMYIGSSPIADISFQASSTDRNITVTQPTYGTIILSPTKSVYQLNETVSASISVPSHYVFNGWTGALSGTENPRSFTVTGNMTLGADVIIDNANPPAQSTITLQQPVGATITLTPQQTSYYNGTSVKAQLTLQSGYQFNGWTGSLSGTTNPSTFTINENMTIGATVAEIEVNSIKRIVSNVTQFKDALSVMNPGDTVLVLDGIYNIGGVKISRGGSSLKPIVVKSGNLYGAKITGVSSFSLSGISYVSFEGFDIDIEPVSTIFKMEGCSYVRITRNRMKMKNLSDTQTSKWITVGEIWENENCRSHHNRIDHNLFDDKYDSGAWVVIDGSHGVVPDISKYDRIDHNIFRNNTPRFVNEKETIRVGVSDLSMLAAYCSIDYNLFEDCDGDPEFVSVKSYNNTVSNNTFRRCLGTLSLRHGNNSTVTGNFFFGEGKTALFQGSIIGCGGVRIYGKNHTVTNNYMEGLTGSKWDAACTITNGDVTNTSSSWSSHFLPENLVFAFNTLVDNKSSIEIGFTNNGAYNKAPINCVIANNIVVAKANQLILPYSTTSLNGVSFNNNIMYATETATLGVTGFTEGEIRQIDPQLQKTDCRAYGQACDNKTPESLYKITATSPAVNSSIGYQNIGVDMEEQPAVGIRDIGADEFNAVDKVKNGPLNEAQVGPTAPESYVYEKEVTAIAKRFINEKLTCSANPFSGAVKIRLPEKAKKAIALFYNTNGILISETVIENTNEIDFKTNVKGLIYCLVVTEITNCSLKLISK